MPMNLISAGFFCGRPFDMELVIRQYERPGNQQRLLQTFTEDVFILPYLCTCIRAFCTMQIYLLTYLLTYLLGKLAHYLGWLQGVWLLFGLFSVPSFFHFSYFHIHLLLLYFNVKR